MTDAKQMLASLDVEPAVRDGGRRRSAVAQIVDGERLKLRTDLYDDAFSARCEVEATVGRQHRTGRRADAGGKSLDERLFAGCQVETTQDSRVVRPVNVPGGDRRRGKT